MAQGAGYLLDKYLRLKDDRDGKPEDMVPDRRKFGSVTSAANIVNMAVQICGVPNLAYQAGNILNYVLQELAQDYDFEQNRKTTTITLTSGNGVGPYALPTDYLRAKNKDVLITGTSVIALQKIQLSEFDWLNNTGATTGVPEYYTTDMSPSPPNMYVFPPPTAASTTCTIRYYSQPADIVNPPPEISTAIPWFPNTNYLITRVAGELMKLTGDPRCGAFLGMGDGSGAPGGFGVANPQAGEMRPQGTQWMGGGSLTPRGPVVRAG